MQEIGEITEYPADKDTKKEEDKTENDTEIGLEAVAFQMGNIVEGLQNSLGGVNWITPIQDSETTVYTLLTSTDKQYKNENMAKTKNTHRNVIELPNDNSLPEEQQIKCITNQERKAKWNPVYGTKQTSVNQKSGNKNQELNPHYQRYANRSDVKQTARPNKQKITDVKKASPSIARNSSPPRNPPQQKKPMPNLQQIFNQIYDPLKQIRDRVDQAIRERKTFTICGNYYSIRRALESRGWLEKLRIAYGTYDRDNLKRLNSLSIHELLRGINDTRTGYLHKRIIMSKLMGAHQVDFYWDHNLDAYRVNKDNVKLTMINRFKHDLFRFSSKQALCDIMKFAYWYYHPGFIDIKHPRSYDLSNNYDPIDFINDFKLTAAMSLLKWIVKTSESHQSKIMSDAGKVPLKTYYFAKAELTKVLQKCHHEDIDYEIQEAMDHQWNEFLQYYYKIVHNGDHFKNDCKENIQSIVQNCKTVLNKIKDFWPHLKMDGYMNIWILKPIIGSRGEGIYLCRSLQYILKVIKSNTSTRYVVQKYIERPLLIYNTKFDIRQWFLISTASPLTVWIYKDCYVRFSSQLYNLRNLHESIHLTNNSVQKRYRNCNRNVALPQCNMWDSNQFKKYLTSIGHPDVFKDIIYPGMKDCLRGAILINEDRLATRKNSFELYGSDFMLTEDFQPWLIEINTCPAIHSSTPVTARMCPQMLDDIIKVVIDHTRNPKASTGRFELLFKRKPFALPPAKPEELRLDGKKLSPKYFYTPSSAANDLCRTSSSKLLNRVISNGVTSVSVEIENTLENLLNIIQNEIKRRRRLNRRWIQALDIKEFDVRNKINIQAPENILKERDLCGETVQNLENLQIIEPKHIRLEIIKAKLNKHLKERHKEANETDQKAICLHESLTLIQNKSQRALSKTGIMQSGNSMNIVRDIINSVWNFTFIKNKSSANKT